MYVMVKLSNTLNRLCRQITEDFFFNKAKWHAIKRHKYISIIWSRKQKNGMIIILQFDDWHLNK